MEQTQKLITNIFELLYDNAKTNEDKCRVLLRWDRLDKEYLRQKVIKFLLDEKCFCDICGEKILLDENKTPEDYFNHMKRFNSFFDVCDGCNLSFSLQEQIDLN